MFLDNGGQYQHALALFHQTGSTTEGTAGQRRGVGQHRTLRSLGRTCRSLLAAGAFHPCWSVDGQDIGSGTVADTDSLVLIAGNQQVVGRRVDGGTIGHFCTSTQNEGRRSNGDILQFT